MATLSPHGSCFEKWKVEPRGLPHQEPHLLPRFAISDKWIALQVSATNLFNRISKARELIGGTDDLRMSIIIVELVRISCAACQQGGLAELAPIISGSIAFTWSVMVMGMKAQCEVQAEDFHSVSKRLVGTTIMSKKKRHKVLSNKHR